jgi:excinuclease ABC subunit A
MHGVILPAVTQHLQKNPPPSSVKTWKSIQGTESFKAIHEVDQSPIGKTSRSCPATYVGLMDDIRQLYAQLPEAKTRGFDASRFSFNSGQGRCETCAGNGYIKIEMAFLPTSQVLCHDCQGMRYNSATLQIQYKGKSIGQVLQMNIDEAVDFFAEQPRLQGRLKMLAETGLGYLQLGQSSATLSGGEAQRLKLVTELSGGYQEKIKETLKAISFKKKNLYLIEEPSIGLHLSDVLKLIEVLHRLTDEGHTVVVIEHHMNLVAEADYIIDIGPEAGEAGGYIVDSGTPEKIATLRRSQTAPYLKAVL